MSEKKVGKRLLTWVLVLVMTLSLLPLNVLADETDAAGDTNTDTKYSTEKSGANLVKSATKNADGTYTIKLESWVTGTVEQTTGSAPLDIVLVLDQSGSMNENGKLDNLKNAVSQFVNKIKQDAADHSVTHRIAIVGFASNKTDGMSNSGTVSPDSSQSSWINTGLFIDGKLKNYQTYQGQGTWENVYLPNDEDPHNNYEYRAYYNFAYHPGIEYNGQEWGYEPLGWKWKSITPKTDENDTNEDHVQVQRRAKKGYIDLTAQDYQAALVDSKSQAITDAIGNLAASGATRASYGMEMASNVFANNSSEGRSRVVVFFTDGEPGRTGYSQSEANSAIGKAYTAKNTYNAKVFSVGMIDEDGGDVGNFMNYVSSNYPDALSMDNAGESADTKYYMNVTNGDLSAVFQQISGFILKPSVAADGSTILTDRLSQYFDFDNDVSVDENGTVTGVTVQKQKYNGGGQWGNPEAVENVDVALDPTTKNVTVSGFKYSSEENVVTEGATPSGYKLVVTFNVKPDTSCTSWTAADRYVTNNSSATLGKDGSDPFATVASPEAPVETYRVKYTVNGEAPESATYEDGKHYITGQTANVLPRPYSPVVKDGYTYTFNGWKNGNDSVGNTVAIDKADVELTGTWAKAATKYTITYNLNGGELAEDKTNPETYTVDTDTFMLNNPTKQGYTFAGWTGTDLTTATTEVTVAEGSTGNRTYTATWTPNGSTGYTVQHYQQNLDGTYPENASESETLTGTTGQEVTATAKGYTGFTFDSSVAGTLQEGTIAADGSLVLKLYYTRNSYTVTYEYTNTTPSDATPALPTAGTYKYGATVDVAAAPTSATHDFSGWSTSDATIDSGKFTMPNKPVKLSGSWTANEVEPTLVDVTVNYYKDSVTTEADTNCYLNKFIIKNQPVDSTITIGDVELNLFKPTTGGYMNGVQQGTVPYTVQEEDNIINVLYTKEIKPDTVLGVLNQYVKKQFNSTYGYSTTAEFTVDATVTKNIPVINALEGQIAAQELSPVGTYTGTVSLSTGTSKSFGFSGTEDTPLEASTHYQVTVKERDANLSYVTCDTAEHTFNFATNANGKVNDIQGVTITNTYYYKHTYRPPTPTVVIPDDDALGLNTTDHFAYIIGYGNGEVRPQNNITRAEVATIFFRLLTDDVRDENLTKTNRYSDVAATSWYNTAVSTLSSMGIITGYPDGTFRPNAAITRAEFAAIAARFDSNGDKTAAKFSDIATHWAKDEISIAYNNGWITGYPDGTFGPQRDITRAETMTLVNRVLNRQPETEDDLLPNMTVWTDNANPKAWYYLAVQEATNSHYYKFKTNSKYEKWTELRETRDWTQLEK